MRVVVVEDRGELEGGSVSERRTVVGACRLEVAGSARGASELERRGGWGRKRRRPRDLEGRAAAAGHQQEDGGAPPRALRCRGRGRRCGPSRRGRARREGWCPGRRGRRTPGRRPAG